MAVRPTRSAMTREVTEQVNSVALGAQYGFQKLLNIWLVCLIMYLMLKASESKNTCDELHDQS